MPLIAFLDILITINSRGSTMGKLKIAIRVVFCPALETIPEIMVSDDEKPIEASTKFKTNNP